MNRENRTAIVNAVDQVVNLQGMAEVIADHIIIEGTDNVTFESLTFIRFRPDGSDREKVVTPPAAKRILAAINFYQVFNHN